MADELFRIQGDAPAVDDLKFWSLLGHESLSRAAHYELTVLSENRSIAAADVLGYPFDVVIRFQDAQQAWHERHCQGHAVRFLRVRQVGRHFEYRITLRSWFWLLTKRRNSRIFQEMPVLDILDAVFEDSPLKRYKKTSADDVIDPHPPHRYCVQFEQSDHDFASRLLEDEGIYYWFDAHDAPGTMLLADTSSVAHDKLPVESMLAWQPADRGEARYNEISAWIAGRRLDTGKWAAVDSDFKKISWNLQTEVDASAAHELGDFEEFEFPGDYFESDDGESVMQRRSDELQARRERHWAITPWPDVAVGKRFDYQGDPDPARNGEYLIGSCTFVVSHPGYEGMGEQAGGARPTAVLADLLEDDAFNHDTRDVLDDIAGAVLLPAAATRGARQFVLGLMPASQPYKPPRLTPRMRMPGPQTAIVVGPEGEELHVDDFGRVKVHFHWDRYDDSNETSTCWLRVSQPWAGQGWGGYFVPRIGQEVIVQFLNGDPDRPVIMGRVYNDEQPIPYDSPTKSGFKTRSTPGGDSTNYNEILFEDKMGEELLSIHAERDMQVRVERDENTLVDQDRVHTVTRNDTNMVGADQKNTVKGEQNNQVVGNRTSFVDSDDMLTVTGQSLIDVIGPRHSQFRDGETHAVFGDQSVSVSQTAAYQAAKMTFTVPEVEWSVETSKKITVSDGPLDMAANEIALTSNTDIEMMAVGNINQTALGADTTILGSGSSGYIGMRGEATLGMNRSTFMGMSISNAASLAMENFGGLALKNALGLTLSGSSAPEIKARPIDVDQAALKTISPGAGGGLVTAAVVGGAVGGLAGIWAGVSDVRSALEQYADAAQKLEKAAKEAEQRGLEGLAKRLNAMAAVSEQRRGQAVTGLVAAGAVAGVATGVGAVASAVAGVGAAASAGFASGLASGGAAVMGASPAAAAAAGAAAAASSATGAVGAGMVGAAGTGALGAAAGAAIGTNAGESGPSESISDLKGDDLLASGQPRAEHEETNKNNSDPAEKPPSAPATD